MKVKPEIPGQDYKFNCPYDTTQILYSEIIKEGIWEYIKQKKKEEKKDWQYRCKNDFEKNIALLFGKFISESTKEKEEKENKDKYLKLVIDEFNNFKKKTNLIDKINKRNNQLLQKLKDSGVTITSFQATCQWRLVIGLGASHPQETSMTLHHIYGIPYIPGSAVKGVTRHWFILKEFDYLGIEDLAQINCLEKILEIADVENRDEKKRDDKLPKDEFNKKFSVKKNGKVIQPNDTLYEFLKTKQNIIKEFQNIFGTQNKKGKAIFFDAFPSDKINLKIDIMNPHYPDYYGGETIPPADWQNPRPIKFLTVEKTKFHFWLASRDADLLEKAENLLKSALKKYGIGAKTSLGYGFFEGI